MKKLIYLLTFVSTLALAASGTTELGPTVGGGGGGAGVSSLNSLTGALNLLAGTGISITPSGSNITITNTGAGSGTVTSVDASVPAYMTLSGNPITTSGTLAFDFASETQNKVFSSPNGSSGVPSFRALVSADIPSLSYVSSVSGTAPVVSSGGLTPAISMHVADATHDGYLSQGDWSTFNSKGSGTVTSVDATVPSTLLTISGNPITTAGTLAFDLATQNANRLLIGPVSGPNAQPTFRLLVADDLPGGSAGKYMSFDVTTGKPGESPFLQLAQSPTGIQAVNATFVVPNTVTGMEGYIYNPVVDGASINAPKSFEIIGTYGSTTPTPLSNPVDILISPNYDDNVTITGGYTGIQIGANFTAASSVDNYFGMIEESTLLNTTTSVQGISIQTQFGNGGSASTTNMNSVNIAPTINSTSNVTNYKGISINPNFVSGSTNTSFYGIEVSPVGVNATNVTGLHIDVQSAVASNNKNSIVTDGGTLGINSQVNLISSASFQVGNSIGLQAHALTPITGTDFIGNSLLMVFDAQDNVANGPSGLGVNQVGYIGQMGVAAGKTVDQFNGVVSGYSAAAATGSITDTAAYVAAGPIGATPAITNSRGFYVPPIFNNSGGTITNAWGVYVAPTNVDNFFAKDVQSPIFQQPALASTMSVNTADNTAVASATNTSLLLINTGSITDAGSSGNTGASLFSTGANAGSGVTGDILYATGDATVGNSGGITLQIGASPATRGQIAFVDGTEGTAGYCWTSTDTAGHGSWQACAGGGGGANQTLSNLTSPTAINQDLYSATDLGHSLGQAGQRWSQLYVDTIPDNAGNVLISVTGELLSDSTANASIDWQNRIFNGVGGTPAFDYSLTTGSLVSMFDLAFNISGVANVVTPNDGGTFGGASADLSVRSGDVTVVASGDNTGVMTVKSGNIADSGSSGTTGDMTVVSGNTAGTRSTGAWNGGSGDVTGTSTGPGRHSGDVNLFSGGVSDAGSSARTGDVTIKSGDNAGSGQSGSINLTVGNVAGGQEGQLVVKAGQFRMTAQSAPSVSSCGTSPSISGSDVAGSVTIGTGGVATSCTITFANVWSNAPHCFLNDQTDITALQAVTVGASLTINKTTPFTASSVIDYFCVSN